MIFLSIDLGKLEGDYCCPIANFRTFGSPKIQFIPFMDGADTDQNYMAGAGL
jgi:hypothetical protein